MRLAASWPMEPPGGDPFVGSWPQDDLGWVDYQRWGHGVLDAAGYRDAARHYLNAWQRRALGEPHDLARWVELLGPAPHAPMMEHAIGTAGRPVSAEELLRLTTDNEVQAGNDAPDAVLGPWADGLDVGRPLQRRALVHAVAMWGFVRMGHEAPWYGWCRSRPRPSRVDRAAVQVVEQVPLALFDVVGRDGDRWVLRARVPLEPSFAPTEPVCVPDYGAVMGQLRVGGALLARVHPVAGQGWHSTVALALAESPPPVLVDRWLAEVLELTRLWERRAGLQRALRHFSHIFSRRCHGWLWLNAQHAGVQ